MRVQWFDLKPTANFSPFTTLDKYKVGPKPEPAAASTAPAPAPAPAAEPAAAPAPAPEVVLYLRLLVHFSYC